MVNVHDVAAYILKKKGSMSAMKLQKLLYYVQAWSLVWDDRPLFNSEIQAWANGPVVPDVYEKHRGEFHVKDWPEGDKKHLDQDAVETLDAVLEYYGGKSPHWLRNLTHMEDPWINARKGLSPKDRGEQEITHAEMVEYYGSL